MLSLFLMPVSFKDTQGTFVNFNCKIAQVVLGLVTWRLGCLVFTWRCGVFHLLLWCAVEINLQFDFLSFPVPTPLLFLFVFYLLHPPLPITSLQETYEAKRNEFLGELQKKEEDMRQMFVMRVKEKEAELKEAEKDVRESWHQESCNARVWDWQWGDPCEGGTPMIFKYDFHLDFI